MAGKTVFLYVYSNGCHHCQRFMPVWASFVSDAKPRFPGISFEKVSSREFQMKPLYAKVKTPGYVPFLTLLTFTPSGALESQVNFSGDRSVPALMDFAKFHTIKAANPQERQWLA